MGSAYLKNTNPVTGLGMGCFHLVGGVVLFVVMYIWSWLTGKGSALIDVIEES